MLNNINLTNIAAARQAWIILYLLQFSLIKTHRRFAMIYFLSTNSMQNAFFKIGSARRKSLNSCWKWGLPNPNTNHLYRIYSQKVARLITGLHGFLWNQNFADRKMITQAFSTAVMLVSLTSLNNQIGLFCLNVCVYKGCWATLNSRYWK